MTNNFSFHIRIFSFLCSKVLSCSLLFFFISQLIRYARATSKYDDFVIRARRLASKLCFQGYDIQLPISSMIQFFNRYSDRISNQNRSTGGCSNSKSENMKSSGENGLKIRTNASPKWDRTRCPEE